MSEPEVIDAKAIERLREWGGDKLVAQMVKLFLANSPTRVDQIRNGVAGSDLKETERGAHSLKSSAANVGAEEVRRISLAMEGAATAGDLTTVADLIPALEEAYSRTRTALEAVERGLPS
jgi:HPt (histidine-containing phosphotransfer) domain-containing protein